MLGKHLLTEEMDEKLHSNFCRPKNEQPVSGMALQMTVTRQQARLVCVS